jgi:hypothetical protein
VLIATESFDFGDCFQPASNRFSPLTAGYYLVQGQLAIGTNAAGIGASVSLRKNGTSIATTQAVYTSASTTEYGTLQVSAIVYMDAIDDYVELWGYISATNPFFIAGAALTNFSAVLVRAA